MNAETALAKKWLAKAQNDLLNADNNLRSKVIPHDTVCFHFQQAAEKLLKAYLVAKGFHPPFTHDLLLLLEQILPNCSDVEVLRDQLALLMPYAVGARYPDASFMPTHEDTCQARKAAEDVPIWFRSHLGRLFPSVEATGQMDPEI